MKIRSDMRLGRLPSDVVVFEHSFGLTVDRPQMFPHCSCGWVGRADNVESARFQWRTHLVTKNMKESE